MPTGDILDAPESGTPCYKGQNVGSQWCLPERGSTVCSIPKQMLRQAAELPAAPCPMCVTFQEPELQPAIHGCCQNPAYQLIVLHDSAKISTR